MRKSLSLKRTLSAIVLLFFSITCARAQETVFTFEAANPGDFAAAHAATDFTTYTETTLKVSGPLNGDDINAIKTAISQRFTTLDIGGAKITSEGQ